QYAVDTIRSVDSYRFSTAQKIPPRTFCCFVRESRTTAYPNFPVLGNPLGTIRPALARAPIHSANSSLERLNVRSAESSQERPASRLNVFRSDTPPSLYFCSLTPLPRVI